MEETASAVSCRGLGRRFGSRWVLAHVDLSVGRGESLLLAGANGSGKTTLLRVIAGLSRPTAGEVRIFDQDPHAERLACRRRLAMVSHRSYLYDRLTAIEMLRIWARLCEREIADEELETLLDEVALSSHRDLLIGGFSAGMRKRLTLLRTRLERPEVLLLDEPLAALDVAGKRLIQSWIEREVANGTTVIVASHAIARMSSICERAILLESGQIDWSGRAADLPAQVEASS
jgi:heme exporter protein A